MSPRIRAHTLMVSWHQEQGPIYSVDFQSNGTRLATGGSDYKVRMWRLKYEEKDGERDVKEAVYLSTLSGHGFTVNSVRFNPKGKMLASADDDGVLIIWELSDGPVAKEFGDEDDKQYDLESWRQVRKIQVFKNYKETYDIAWSPDGKYIICGSMQNIACVVEVSTGNIVRELAEHSGIVQGVAWDPLNEYIATQSSDRAVHIYSLLNKDGHNALESCWTKHDYRGPQPVNVHKMDKAELPIAAQDPPTPTPTSAFLSQSALSLSPSGKMDPPPVASRTHSRKSSFNSSTRSESPVPMALPLPAVRQFGSPRVTPRSQMSYANESATAFFRRLTFTPDGSLLLTPTGLLKSLEEDKPQQQCTVYIYTRRGLNRPPVAHLPGMKNPSLAVRCSPVIYKLRKDQVSTHHITVDTSKDAKDTSALPESIDSKSSDKKDVPVFKLAYRMVYAVATKDTVAVYDTQQPTPLCIISNMSYLEFTDLSWSRDGKTLIVSSTDGFCSVVVFQTDALGEPLAKDELAKLVPTFDQEPEVITTSENREPENLRPTITHVPPAALHNHTLQEKRPSTASSSASDTEHDKKKRRIQPQLISQP